MAVTFLLGSLAAALVSRAGESPVDAMAWMEGHWTGVTGEVRIEEHWTSPAGNALIGMHKDVKNGTMVDFEFLRIEAREDGVYYLASPSGRPPTAFKLVEQGNRRLVFENPEHDFPQRILYWSEKPGELCARVEGAVKGETKSMEWRWTRAAGR